MRRADIEVPILPVDVDSWGRPACYPRSTFYPLSDGPSTRHHRITRPDFRPCSRRPSRSQAPFCPYTHHTVSNRAEGTLGRLRYLLGGDRPSQTARLTLSLGRITPAGENLDMSRVVSQGWLHGSWRSHFSASHLSCTRHTRIQCQVAVKVHGVFPSSRG
jgi:hypothetical protein